MKNKLIPKHQKAGKLLINEPVSESTYKTQPQLNINERELLNFIQSNPDVEDWMMREYAVKHSTSPTSNQGVIVEAKEDNIKNNFFRDYNNFRYSHPWAKGLNWTPIVGDVMDGISLLGDVNNGDYLSAGLGLGMLALPNFIQKPMQKYGSLQMIPDNVWDELYDNSIKTNNLKQTQQLRDLHFLAKAPYSVIKYPVFHNTKYKFNIFDLSKFGKHDNGFFGYGIYVTPNNNYASLYGPIQKKLYLNVTNPYDGMDLEGFNRAAQRVLENENQLRFKLTQLDNGQLPDDYYLHEPYIKDKSVEGIKEYYKNIYKFNNDNILSQYAKKNPQYVNKDAAISYRVDPHEENINTGDLPAEIVVPNNTSLKLADAITYDDYGNIIPLSKRDDFTNPDTRYSWLIPTVPFGLMSYKLSKQNEQNQYKKGGKLKSKKNIKKCQEGDVIDSPKRLNIKKLQADPEYKKYNWYIDEHNINALQDSLINRGANYPQRIALLSMVIPESGGDPDSHGNGAYGLIGWRGVRAEGLPSDFGGQAHVLMEGLFNNSSAKHWTHGGPGTGVMTGKEMYELFNKTNNTQQATKALMKGYIRPEQSEYDKRLNLAELIKKYME